MQALFGAHLTFHRTFYQASGYASIDRQVTQVYSKFTENSLYSQVKNPKMPFIWDDFEWILVDDDDPYDKSRFVVARKLLVKPVQPNAVCIQRT